MYRPARTKLVLVTLLIGLVAGCNQKSKTTDVYADADGPLRFVAADTPYLFASLEPIPDDVYDKMKPRLDKLIGAYQKIIRVSIEHGIEQGEAENNVSDEHRQRIAALAEKMLGLMSSDGIGQAGFDRDSTFMLYGQGLLPVLRVTLSDVDAFEKTLTEFEAEIGTPMQKAQLDNLTYRFGGDEEARVVIGVMDDQMVMSLVPTTLTEDSLRQVFGLKRPSQSIVASGKLQNIAREYGFAGYAAGFIDFEKVVDTFLDEQTGINAELLAMGGYDSSQYSDVCKAEIRGIAEVAPRLITGYTEFTADRIAANTVLELRSDIADGLATLPAIVPGLGKDHGGLVSFGMSIDLLAAREFYEARLDAMEANPYKCELLAGLQAGTEKGRAMLNQPIPPIVYGLKGFLAIIDNVEGLDIESKQPPTALDMRFLLATDNAPGLVAMGAMFSPELAALNMQADGEPVRVESPQLQGPIQEAWMAMNGTAAAVAVGEGGKERVKALLEADAVSPPPAFAMHMDASRYYSLVGDAVKVQADEEVPQEMSAAIEEMMTTLAAFIDRVGMTVMFTDRGIELPTLTTLKD